MDENEIEAGLRGLTLMEPTLGFSPDDVAAQAAKRERTRRASLAVGAGTVAVATVAVIVFGTAGGESLPLTPAGSAGSTPTTSSPYYKSPAKPMDPAHDLTAQVARNKNHLMQVLPTLKKDVRELEVLSANQDYPTEPKGWDETSVAVQFMDSTGLKAILRGKAICEQQSCAYRLTPAQRPVEQAPAGGRELVQLELGLRIGATAMLDEDPAQRGVDILRHP